MAYELVAALVVALGIIGCIVPMIPGPLVAYAGLFVLLISPTAPSLAMFVWLGVACALVTLADYFLPPLVARRFGGGRAGAWGSLLGTLVGMAFFPIGLVLGGFLGACAFEKFVAKKGWRDALVAGVGAFLGFLLGTAAKLAYCAGCMVVVFSA